MGKLDELKRLSDEISALGLEIESKRKRALELANGMIAVCDRDDTYIVRSSRVLPGSWRLWLEGPRLKADGKPHARAAHNYPVALIRELRPAPDTDGGKGQ